MNYHPKIIAIITAREGSKGVVDKNLREIGGISLVGRSILAALETKFFDKVILTTDGQKIADEGRKYGAEVVLRPKALSGDGAKSIDAVVHAFQYCGINSGVSVLLQPTSPLRTSRHIREAIDKFLDTNVASLVSVCEAEHHPYKTFLMLEDGLQVMHSIDYLDMPRQNMPKALRLNGALFVNRVEDLLIKRSFYNEPIDIYEMSNQSSIDIDSELDLKIANVIVEEKIND